MRLLNIGYGNVVVAERVVAVISPESAPMKRFKDEARKAGRLIDGTQGRRTRSILITDSHHIVLSALQTETVAERLERGAGTSSSSPRPSGATPLPPEDEAPDAQDAHDLDAHADADHGGDHDDEADAPDGGDHDDGPSGDDGAHG